MGSAVILKQIYKNMLLIRLFEEKIGELFADKRLHGTTHLYIGQEAIAAGVCSAIAPDDVMLSTHRGHGHCIAKGIDLNSMMAEFFGKQTGCCQGKGGSMHIADTKNGNLGSNGIVGGGIPLAVGAALSIKMQKQNRIAVCFFGDGAVNQGTFHESLNLASVWKLPVLFVCEDNLYGFSMKKSNSMAVADIAKRAESYGIMSKTIDGNDAPLVHSQTKQAREYVLNSGPMLLVCETYRIAGHSKSDKNAYRTEQEIEQWRKKDPIARMKNKLLSTKVVSQEDIQQIEQNAAKAIEKAMEFAEKSTNPKAEDVYSGVYA